MEHLRGARVSPPGTGTVADRRCWFRYKSENQYWFERIEADLRAGPVRIAEKWEWCLTEKQASDNNTIIRYADGAVFFFKNKKTADAFLNDLQKREHRLGLTLNTEKTHTADFRRSKNDDLDLLGFTIVRVEKKKYRLRAPKFKVEKKSLHKKMQEFDRWVNVNRGKMKRHHFYSEAIKSLFKGVNRGGQKRPNDREAFKRRRGNIPRPEPPDTQHLKCLGRRFHV